MNNRVYGIIGIGSYMANWNADFSSHPKTLGNGMIFGSDKALKYSIRNHMILNGGMVMFFKSFKEVSGKLQPSSIDEKYKALFNVIEKGKSTNKEVLTNLLKADDVMNFGATYAEKSLNVSVLGVVQIGQGFNKYEDTEIHTQDILSPFRNSEKEDADANTLGTQTITDEAHYIYPFSVNPSALRVYQDLIPGLMYEEKHYNYFKNGALEGATLLNTASKMGCENEFGVFIKVKENSELYLPSLDSYVEITKNDFVVYDLTKLINLLNGVKEEIENIEVYYNPVKIKVEGLNNLYIKKDIITKKEI